MATHGEIRWPPVGTFDGRLRGDSHGHRHRGSRGDRIRRRLSHKSGAPDFVCGPRIVAPLAPRSNPSRRYSRGAQSVSCEVDFDGPLHVLVDRHNAVCLCDSLDGMRSRPAGRRDHRFQPCAGLCRGYGNGDDPLVWIATHSWGRVGAAPTSVVREGHACEGRVGRPARAPVGLRRYLRRARLRAPRGGGRLCAAFRYAGAETRGQGPPQRITGSST